MFAVLERRVIQHWVDCMQFFYVSFLNDIDE